MNKAYKVVDSTNNKTFYKIDGVGYEYVTTSSDESDELGLDLTPSFGLDDEGNPINQQNVNPMAPKYRILDVILQNNYEFKYDLALIKFISKNLYFKDIKGKIFVEIFPTSLRNNQFKNEILKLIDNNLIDPKKIVFEFNEKQICNELKRFHEIVYQFKELGFDFALSQFGGPNASFEYFKHLDIDFIVYDMEFNKNFYDPKVNKIFTNLNEMCKKIGIKTIVRFVDKKAFYDDLANSGIDFIQGFCIDKPTDLENLRENR